MSSTRLLKGHVKILEKDLEIESKKWCLSHFAVIKSNKQTTKIIIIFVASAAQDGFKFECYHISRTKVAERFSSHVIEIPKVSSCNC